MSFQRAAGGVFCYAFVPNRWVVGGAINNGGSVLAWIGEALAPDLGEDAAPRLVELAEKLCGGSLTPLLMNLVRARRLSTHELRELQELIDELSRQSPRKGERR